MPGTHSLRGLMKWLTRDEWRDRFAAVYDAHLQPACERLGVDVDEVVSILGQDWFMTTVWGSAFEDFLTRDFDGGYNIADDYLKRRGWKESASTRAYITALRTSVASLYEVSDIIKDTSFRARDLVRGGNPILISERSATRSLKQWDRIAARVVQVGADQWSIAAIPTRSIRGHIATVTQCREAYRYGKTKARKQGWQRCQSSSHCRWFLPDCDATRCGPDDHDLLADRHHQSHGRSAGS